MNKQKTVAFFILCLISLLFCFTSCQIDDGYVHEQLANDQYPIYQVSFPTSPLSSTLHMYHSADDIKDALSTFDKLSFTFVTEFDATEYANFLKGEYGLPVDSKYAPNGFGGIGEELVVYKYIISIIYGENHDSITYIGNLMIDYDGTVYYVNDKDQKLYKTVANAIPTDDFYVSNATTYLK